MMGNFTRKAGIFKIPKLFYYCTLSFLLLFFKGDVFSQVSTFPYLESFDSWSTCGTSCGTVCTLPASSGWLNPTDDTHDWLINSGTTSSSSTGPSGDHTSGSGNYLYTETTSPCNGGDDTFHLVTPIFDFTLASGVPEMNFWYHMYGQSMGSLHLDVSIDGGSTWTNDIIPSWTDNLDQWQEKTVNLSAYATQSNVRFRLRSISGLDFYSDMAIDDFAINLLVQNNAGISNITAPVAPLSAGIQNVEVELYNYGTNNITSVDINWNVNGNLQTTYAWTGTLAPGTGTNVVIGTYNFPSGTSTITAWTSNPNNVVDPIPADDSASVTLCTALVGTYTINAGQPTAGTNYNSFADAVTEIYNCGIGGAVVFNIAPGTYVENIHLMPIAGSSSTNTITFDGSDSSLVTLTYSSSSDTPTVFIEGADYITLRNMTIENTSTSDGWGIMLQNEADHITVDMVHVRMPITSTTDIIGLIASSSLSFESSGNNANNLTVSNSLFTGGESGVTLDGGTSRTSHTVGNTIINNTFRYQDDHGIEVDGQTGLVIFGNDINDMQNTGGDGIYLVDIDEFDVSSNKVASPDYGIYINDGNDGHTPVSNSTVINNMVYSSSDYGLYLNDIEYVVVYHNTLVGEPAMQINDQDNVLIIKNNIMYSTADLAFNSLDALNSTDVIDYNLYYSGGANLAEVLTTVYPDLAAWQLDAPTRNVNSLEALPLFVDPFNDLHVTGPIAAQAGDPTVGVTTDIDGDIRPIPVGTNPDLGADEYLANINDAAVADVFTLPGGNVVVEVLNFGTAPLTSVDVYAAIDNGTTVTVLGPTSPASTIAPGSTDTVTVGYYPLVQGMMYQVTAWTANPNNLPDEDTSNDTFSYFICTPMSGTYTLNTSSPTLGTNFNSFTAVANALSTCGVVGPVTINIAPGTYIDNLHLMPITGSSSTNTITFDGSDSSMVTLTYASSIGMPTVFLEGADYITLRNMTIENTSSGDGWGIMLQNEADYNTIDMVHVRMPITSTTDIIGLIASNSLTGESAGNNANNLTVSNSLFTGGESGVTLDGGTTSTSHTLSNTIINNTFRYQDDHGIEADGQTGLSIIGNDIDDLQNSGADAIYLIDINDFNISANRVASPDWGIYVNDGNDGHTPTSNSSVINNMVYSSSDYGLYLNDIEYVEVYHNTLVGEPAMQINDQSNVLIIKNNIMYSTGDYAFESLDALNPTDVIDYNLYYSGGADAFEILSAVYADLAAWQAADPGLNVNSVEGDPIFVDQFSDLHVIGILANDAGDNSVGVNVDIDGQVRPMAPSTIVDIGADEYTPAAIEVELTTILSPVSGCGDSNTVVSVIIKNLGTTNASNIPVTVDVTGPVPTILTGVLAGPLLYFESDTLVVGTFNTFNGGTYDLTAYTQLIGDENLSNDTATTNVSFEAIPVASSTFGSQCVESGTMVQVIADSLDWDYTWYDGLGNLLGTGDTFVTGAITTDTEIFAEASKEIFVFDSLFTTMAAGNSCGGGNMFDITAFNTVMIDSFAALFNSSGAQSVSVYYKTGSYVGSETTSTDWTLLGTTSLTSSTGTLTNIDVGSSLTIPAGATYGIYVEFDAAYTNGDFVYSNTNIQIETGVGLCSSFGGTNASRTFNGTVYYTAGSSCTGPLRLMADINVNPAPTITPEPNACFAEPARTLQVDISGGVWSGTGITDPAAGIFNPGVAGIGTHQIVYTLMTANGCTGADTINIIVNSSPNATISGPYEVCFDAGLVTFTAPSAGGIWMGTGITDPINGIFDPALAGVGSYVISYEIDLTGCQDIDTHLIHVRPAPNASFGSFGPLCSNDPAVTLNPAEPGGNFTGTGVVGNMFDPAVAGPGFHQITYSITNSLGCSNTESITVEVRLQPDATISGPSTLCFNDAPVQYTVPTTGGIWTGSGLSSTGLFNPAMAGLGTHVITYTFFNNGCNDTDTMFVTVNSVPNAMVNMINPICVNDAPIQLTANIGNGIWSGTGVNANGMFDPSIAGVGTHTVTYSVTGINGCTGTTTRNVTVVNAPNVSLTASGPYCTNDNAVVLSGSPSGGVWAGNGIINQFTGLFNPVNAGAGTHTISYTVTNGNGCSTTETMMVTVNTAPNATITAAGPFCGNATSVQLAAATPGGTWSGTGVSASGMFNPVTAGPGMHTITYTVTNTIGCTSTSSRIIAVSPEVAVNGIVTSERCAGQNNGSISLTVEGGLQPFTYNWNNGATSRNLMNIAPGSYSVTVTDAAGCITTRSFTVNQGSNINISVDSIISTLTPSNSNGAVYITVTGGTAPYQYIWSNGSTSQDLNSVSTDSFTVTVIDAMGCRITQTVFVPALFGVGIDQVDKTANIQLYPNPSSGRIILDVKLVKSDEVSYEVLDIIGRSIVTNFKGSTSGFTEQLDLSQLAAGQYILKVIIGERIMNKKFVITR